jgi:hypothetical protein
MEQLRIVPILMLFVGILFVYSGLKNQSPSEIIRGVLGPQGTPDLYGPNVNPMEAGVTNAGVLAYQSPSNMLNVGTF